MLAAPQIRQIPRKVFLPIATDPVGEILGMRTKPNSARLYGRSGDKSIKTGCRHQGPAPADAFIPRLNANPTRLNTDPAVAEHQSGLNSVAQLRTYRVDHPCSHRFEDALRKRGIHAHMTKVQ